MDTAPVDAWSLAEIPDQAGRTVVVTGPSLGGLGFHTALELARRGARVVLAGRSEEKLVAAAQAIRDELGGDQPAPERLQVDLADLASVRAAGGRAADLGPIDVLVNNAGVMATPAERTVDGFERQLATNHLGPFLLTGLLLPQLAASEAGVVVTVSSLFHRRAKHAPTDDPRAQGSYGKWQGYARSKLANLLFTLELDRRCREAAIPVRALAAHPGVAGSNLVPNGQFGGRGGLLARAASTAVRLTTQPVEAGAWPSLMAATADLPGGTYCGPGGLGETAGTPQVVVPSALARDEAAQREVWEVSERAVGLSYPDATCDDPSATA